ncbi:MAG: redoxin domain-containing protein [Acidobacteria bacterium]|nr:redoxin domain-containing protein [Acidobacteriota bacterium]MXZ72598.1 redoxin domain-containing protein [Acidobacteriota bacterium]MYJ02890.1 redoxin domain-containing protein [Acidobacteriota bacterium]
MMNSGRDVMADKHARTPNDRRLSWMAAVIVLPPLFLGLLLVAARHDVARSGMAVPPDSIRGAASARTDIDPDWAVVEEYLDLQNAWSQRMGEIAAGLPAEERNARIMEAFADRPDIRPAIAAATAIIDAGGDHDRVTEAAEFLVIRTVGEPDAGQHMARGAQALLAHAPNSRRWPAILRQMDARRFHMPDGRSSTPDIDRFFEEAAADAESPSLRAMAQYYVASGFMRSANALRLDEEQRNDWRQRALDAAEGLSAGVEDELFDGATAAPALSAGAPGGPVGAFTPRTFSEAEADLIQAIRHATPGGTALDIAGRRLDGAEDSLSAHRGRVVLIDFWATWCPPCIDALPELRELVSELPADRFTLLAISIDDELETVNRFLERESMPWVNWHVGPDNDIRRTWDLRGVPVYVLVDEEGLILARSNSLPDWFTTRIREAVTGEDARPADTAVYTWDPPDIEELRRAAEEGDPEAQVQLGQAYQSGNGVAMDDDAATAWYLRAAEQGSADAQFHLGFAYSGGSGVPLDYNESHDWFERAAEQGHDAAQWMLGSLFYSFGRGDVARDDVKGAMWLYLAVSQNDRHDRTTLDMLEARMTPAQIEEAQRLAREWREARE